MMNIEIEDRAVHITGVRQLDKREGFALKKAVLSNLPQALDYVGIDLSEAKIVDAAGLAKLARLQQRLQKHDSGVVMDLEDPSAEARQWLRLTRLDKVLSISERSQPKKAVLSLFAFVDACGWEIIRNDPFATALAPHRRKLRSVFGYSSACIPSILSGRWPDETRNWCYFVRDPENSPFRSLKTLRWLPKAVTSRRIFRRWLSKFLRGPLKFRGYFDLYNIPFRHISLFDFSEKKNPLEAGGLNQGPNVFDYLEDHSIPYHVSLPERSELDNLKALEADIRGKKIDFAFLYWPALDGLMHETGNQSERIYEKLRQYEEWLDHLMATAHQNYEEVRLYVFSDHGMANCDSLLDLRKEIDALGLKMPRDYTVVYDSTMARFWFHNEKARDRIVECLQVIDAGRIIEDAELKALGAFFPDRYFGELIFLVKEGVLIVPSDMGERPLRGMHGYHPDDPQSYASLLSNIADLPEEVTDIPHIYQLMIRDAEYAHAANSSEHSVPRSKTSPAQDIPSLV